MSRAFRLRPPAPASTTLLAVFLTVMLALSCGVALQAYGSARSQRATAEAVLRDYAGIAAAEYGRFAREDLSRFFDVAFDEIPRRERAGRMPGVEEILWDLDDAARAIRCPCDALLEPELLFIGDLRDGSVHDVEADPMAQAAGNGGTRGEPGVAPGTPLDPSGLVATIRQRALAEPTERYGLVVLEGERARPLVYAIVIDEQDRPVLAYGVVLPPAAFAELARDWYEEGPLLPPAIAGEETSDSTVRIELAAPGGPALFASTGDAPPHPGGLDTLGTRYGQLTVHASIRPEAAERLIIGGLPSSRVPFSLGLLALTLMAGVAGLWEVRRHHHLAQLREDFISSVSHELRTPLTQIRMLAELQADEKLRTPEERARANRVVAREARRLTHLVENILQFSRSRARRPAPASETIPVAACVDEVVESFRPLSGNDSASFTVDIDPSLAVVGDREALRRVLINLVDNALKYGPGGQMVTISAGRARHAVRLVVEDEGPGVPESSRSEIWEPYRRLARDVDSHRPGSGVGLAVVRALVDGLDGRAWVESADGGGARFVVELPPADGPAAEHVSSPRADTIGAPARTARPEPAALSTHAEHGHGSYPAH